MFHQFKLVFVLVLYMRLFLESHASSDICTICSCRNSQTHIDCSFRNLISVPQSLPPTVEYLYLYRNNIKKLGVGDFQNLPNLRTILLFHNQIKEIDVGAFQNIPSLMRLDLDSNQIKKIEVGTFHNQPNLRILYLNNNDIDEVEVELFEKLSSLRSLYLHDNNITNIKDGTFEALHNLENLYLDKNNMEEIKVRIFNNLTSLIYLNLGSNKIKEIQAGTFQNLTNLITLDLHSNKIKGIKAETLQNLSSLITLNLNGNDIKEIQAGTFQNVSSLITLNLGGNQIKEIQVGTFQTLSYLANLDLSANNITEIQAETFRNFSSLTYLNLGDNKITEIKSETFQDLSNLTTLNLGSNKIKEIKADTFQNLSSLITLNLGDNKINETKSEAFQDLSNLITLNLNNNEIKEIKSESFQNLSSLRTLNLGDNGIKEIKSGTFRNLINLITLNLGVNGIKEIKSETFQNLPSLRTLYLQDNNISTIEEMAFDKLTKLNYLNLGSNVIKEIKARTFHNLASLTALYVYNNNITNIERNIFKNLLNLEILDLGGNTIKEIEASTFQNLSSLTKMSLNGNDIKEIQAGTFHNFSSLTNLNLGGNDIQEIKAETFQNLSSLTNLYLNGNSIEKIKVGTLHNLPSLSYLDLHNNQIQICEDGAFLFLPSITYIDLRNNANMTCGCHLPILVNYTNTMFSRTVNVPGECRTDSGNNQSKVIPILEYSQCKNYKLFQRNLPCQTCSGVMCNGPDVTSCAGDEAVCESKISVNDVTPKLEKSCSTYRKCLEGMRNNIFTCSKWTSGFSCVACCTGNVCNMNDFIDYKVFQQNLQCQTCSGGMCDNPGVTSCAGDEAVCESKISVSGITSKLEKSCGTYRKCYESMKNNTPTCDKYTSGSSCVACCARNLCNKNDFSGRTNYFVLHLIYNSTFNKSNEYKTLHENVSRVMEHELLKVTGLFEVKYCGLQANKEIFSINCSIPDDVTKAEVLKRISETFSTSRSLHKLEIQQNKIQLIDGIVCNENTSTSNGTFYWPMTKVGTKATVPCHANVATRYCSSRTAEHLEMPTSQYITSKCSPLTGVWKEPDISQCYNTEQITQQLKNITNEDINKENIEKFSIEILNISKKSVYFKEEDVDLAVDIHERMVQLILNVSTNITVNNILPSMNDMINTPEEVLVKAEESEKTGNRMLDIIETIPDEIPVEKQQVTALYSNIGIGVIKVEEDTFNGALYGVSYGNNGTEEKSLIYNNSNSDPQIKGTVDYISLPKSLINQLTTKEQSSISRVSFFSMQDDKLYRVIQKSSINANSKINSHIIAASLPNIKVTNLNEPVTILFHLIDQNATNPRCVFWDESPGQNPHWSTDGCNITEYIEGKRIFCSCYHLTSFALLMDIYKEKVNEKINYYLSLASNIGCGISLFCLLLTIIIHVCSKHLRKLMASKILVNLCISLAVTNIIFLAGMKPYASKILGVCKAVAALLHYFLMTSLMWMAAEALHVCLAAVIVFKTYHSHFMLKTSIFAWGLPAVIVITNLAINYTDNYIRVKEVCWLSKIPFYASFLAPVVIILIFNFIMFSLILWRLFSMKNDKMFQHQTRKVRIMGIFGLLPLFGLSWVLAFFAFGEVAEVFSFLFTIFNTLQGMFIFIFYCLYKKDTRDVICPCKPKKRDTQGSNMLHRSTLSHEGTTGTNT